MSMRGHSPLASAAPDTVFAPAAIELVDVRKVFGRTSVLNGVGLRVENGERVAVIGPNGAGKSSLFDLISGRSPPSEGEIWLNGRRVDGQSPERLARAGLARSFQVTNLFPKLSVRDTLRCALSSKMGSQSTFWRSVSSLRGVNRRCHELLDLLGLSHAATALAGELGYADQRALEVGVAVAADPTVLLLDEPTAGMSQSETHRFITLIRELTEGRSLLMVEHDMSVVFELADRVAVLVQGAMIAFDTPARVRANPRVQAAYLGVQMPAALASSAPADEGWLP